MRRLRLLLVLLAVAFVVTSALLRPPAGRAQAATGGTHGDPAGTLPESSRVPRTVRRRTHARLLAATRQVARTHARVHAKRRLMASRMRERVLFRHDVVSYAERLVGIPYRYGGTSPRSGFDCSGFVRYVFSHFGISLPHSSFADVVRGKFIPRNDLLPGDLVFFDGAGHVGIYVGHGEFIHAPHSGTVVRISSMNGWYGSRYVGARRLH